MSSSYQQQIVDYYQEWWENPRDPRHIIFQKLNGLVRQRIPPGGGKRALDLGSGKGTIVSYLVEKGYHVAAVDFSPDFVTGLKVRFPQVQAVEADIRNIDYREDLELITMIEVAQNFSLDELVVILGKLARPGRRLLANISNRRSLHGWWVHFRHFRTSFVYHHTPAEWERALKEAGWRVTYRRGVGLTTPITLFRGFRGRLLPVTIVRGINWLDALAPRWCHLYYTESVC